MPFNEPKVTPSIELGWNGLDGYCRNEGLYGLLYDKPVISTLVFDVIQYSNITPTSNYKVIDGTPTNLTEEEIILVEAFAVENALSTPWECSHESTQYLMSKET